MIEKGFSNVAVESAHAFRSIMQAMARPGVPVVLEAALEPPAPLLTSSAAVALTLCDFQTPVWLSPALKNEKIVHYLKFHTGAPIAERLADAQFAFLSVTEERPPLTLFAQGTHEYPDRSATLVIQVEEFHTQSVILEGPGIDGAVRFGVDGLEQDFWASMAENHARFPVGVDVIFAGSRGLAAVPRSTAVRIKETV
jgi:alpha-D-ribose 1-methylphosphonate 5-triphosphate synthase subunit PhnH